MFSPELLTAITIGIYLAATIAGFGGLIWNKKSWCKAGGWLAIASFICQTVILIFGFHKYLPDGLSFGAYMQLVAWFFLLCGIIAWQRMRVDTILLFAAPLGLILFLMSAPWLHVAVVAPGSLSASFYALHIGSLFLALGLVALAFVAGIIFLVLQHRLKKKRKFNGIWAEMPALSVLDKINAVCSICAFPLYTLGVVAGLFWAQPIYGSSFNGDPKEIVSLLVWTLLGMLFYNRLLRGWQGRKPAILVIVVFLLCFFSILCVNLLLSTHHGIIRS